MVGHGDAVVRIVAEGHFYAPLLQIAVLEGDFNCSF